MARNNQIWERVVLSTSLRSAWRVILLMCLATLWTLCVNKFAVRGSVSAADCNASTTRQTEVKHETISYAATSTNSDSATQVEKSFTTILQESESDKYWRHHFERYYEKWLPSYRHKKGLKFAEIGAEEGRSLKTWHDYFTSPSLILGVAYGESSTGVETTVDGYDHVKVLRGDQSDPKTLATMCQKGPFDVIIDDGSHVPEHMVISFMHLWKDCVNPGGLYVVEDLETNYWNARHEVYGYELKGTGIGESPKTNAVEKFKQLIDVLTRYQLGHPSDLSIIPGDDQICSITFGMNIMAFHKCTEEEKASQPMNGSLGTVIDAKHLRGYLEKAKSTNPEMKAN